MPLTCSCCILLPISTDDSPVLPGPQAKTWESPSTSLFSSSPTSDISASTVGSAFKVYPEPAHISSFLLLHLGPAMITQPWSWFVILDPTVCPS